MVVFLSAYLCVFASAAVVVVSDYLEQFNANHVQKVTIPLQRMTMPQEITSSIAPPSWLPLWSMLDFMTPNAQVYINAVAGILDRGDLAKAETFNRASGYIMRFSSNTEYRNTTQWIKVEEFWSRGTIKYSVLEQNSPATMIKRNQQEKEQKKDSAVSQPPPMSITAAKVLYRVFDLCGTDKIRHYYSVICAEADGQQTCVTFSLTGLTCNVIKDVLGNALEKGNLEPGVQGMESPARNICVSSNPIDCAVSRLAD